MQSDAPFQSHALGPLVHITSGKRNSSEATARGRFPFFTCGKEILRIDCAEHDREAVLLGGNNANAIFPVFYANGPFTARQRVYVMWSKDIDTLDNRFLFFALRHLCSSFTASARGTTTLFITLPMLQALQIPLPHISVQRQIAATLMALEERIELIRQANGTLESIAHTLFKSWFIDFDPVRAKAEGREPDGMDPATAAMFPSELEESSLGLVPKGWRIAEVGQTAECVGGGTPSTKETAYWQPAIHYWATPKDLSGLGVPVLLNTERRLSDVGLAKVSSGLLPSGTLLMSSRAPIGYLAIAAMPLAINQGFIAVRPGGLLPPVYLYFWCRANMDVIKQKANGSTFMEISKAAFRPIPVVCPPGNIVARFSDTADALLSRIAEGERHRSQLAQLRDTLLPRLISGRLQLREVRHQMEEAAVT